MNFTLHVGPQRVQLKPRADDELVEWVRKKLRYRVKGYQFMDKYNSGVWDGYINLFWKNNQTAPAGCFMRLKNIVERKGHKVSVEFNNNYEPQGTEKIYGLPGELFGFQKESVKRAVKFRSCILEAAVRAGKTAILASIIQRVAHYPVWLVTYGKDLVKQLQSDLKGHLKRDIGIFSEGVFEAGDIIVTSYQALGRVFTDRPKKSKKLEKRNALILDSIEDCKILLLDECHHILAKKNKEFLKKFNNVGYKIGVSGTPKPDGITRMELESYIGPIVYKVPFDKLIAVGRIAQPVVIMYDLPYTWYQQYLEDYPDVYVANIVENHYRNKFIAKVVSELKKRNKTSYVVVLRRNHGEILQDLIPESVYLHGGVSSEVRKKVYARMNKKELFCIITTVTKEGLNIKTLDAVINAEGLEGYVGCTQKMRSLTAAEGKTQGLVIDFMDKAGDLLKHSEARFRRYKGTAGFIVKKKKISSKFFGEEDEA